MAKRNEQYDQTAKILIESGANCIAECPGPKPSAVNSRLEWWNTRKGLMLFQVWDNGGVASFSGGDSNGMGHTYDELRAFLNSPGTDAVRNLVDASIGAIQFMEKAGALEDYPPEYTTLGKALKPFIPQPKEAQDGKAKS